MARTHTKFKGRTILIVITWLPQRGERGRLAAGASRLLPIVATWLASSRWVLVRSRRGGTTSAAAGWRSRPGLVAGVSLAHRTRHRCRSGCQRRASGGRRAASRRCLVPDHGTPPVDEGHDPLAVVEPAQPASPKVPRDLLETDEVAATASPPVDTGIAPPSGSATRPSNRRTRSGGRPMLTLLSAPGRGAAAETSTIWLRKQSRRSLGGS